MRGNILHKWIELFTMHGMLLVIQPNTIRK